MQNGVIEALRLLCLCGLGAWAWASPALDVGGVSETMASAQSSLQKTVFNRGTSVAYVKVSVVEVLPEEKGERELPEQEASQVLASRDGLVVSPAHLVVPPKGSASVRLIHLGARDQERYFRVRFVPVQPQQGDAFKLEQGEADAYRQSLSAGVRILAGFGVVTIVQPRAVRFDTVLEKRGAQHVLVNRGNSAVVLEDYEVCGPKGCVNAGRRKVFPGHTRVFPVHAGEKHRFQLREGHARRQVELV